MINPVTFFYSKIYQYFTYAGVTVINPHLQSSFLFAATLFYYMRQAITISPIELNPTIHIIVLVMFPLSLLMCYTYFSKDGKAEQLERLYQFENKNDKSLNNALTIALLVPVVVFFTVTAFTL